MKFEGISTALKEGCRLHSFRSGGGLMVVRVSETSNGKLRGYGEHPYVEVALIHADEDYLAGGRKYEDVYGKIHLHYLTGTDDAISPLDSWIKVGRKFDVRWEHGEFVAVLYGWDEHGHPETQTIRGTTLNEIYAGVPAVPQIH